MKKKIIPFITSILLLATSFSVSNYSTTFAAETYLSRDSIFSLNDTNVNRVTSEHFQIIYGNNDTTKLVNPEFLQKQLQLLENCWSLYMDKMSMIEPSESIYSYNNDGKKYKTNVYLTYTGLSEFKEGWAFQSAADGYGFIIISPEALATNVVVQHEYGHVITMHQKSWVDQFITGAWWEATANWFREQYFYTDYFEPNPHTEFFAPYMRNLSLAIPHGRTYYETWPFLQYLTENPDNFNGLGSDFMQKLMANTNKNEPPFDAIARLSGTNIKDILGNYSKRMATFDFKQQEIYKKAFNGMLKENYYWNLVYTRLEKTNDEAEWYQVPTEKAPMQTGMNIIPLSINGTSINVALQSLSDENNADWRACIVTEDVDGNTNYSNTFGKNESQTLSLKGNETKAYLTVISTPDKLFAFNAFNKAETDKNYIYNTGIAKKRYPYKVKINGATPIINGISKDGIRGSLHANGNGFVASTASVDKTAYVGPNAMVLGNAKITGNARVEDYAVVMGNSTVSENAIISGHAIIQGAYTWNGSGAKITGNAKVGESAVVALSANVSGNARVMGNAFITDTFTATDNSTIKGMAFCYGNGVASEQAVFDGDYADNQSASKGVQYGWLESANYINNRPYENNLYTSYDFSRPSQKIAYDKYASTDGYIKNEPLWEQTRSSADGTLTFNGLNQYIVTDNTVADFKDIELRTAILWKGGKSNQKVFYFGNEKSYLYFTPSNENNKSEFVISNGITTQKLTASSSLVAGEWSIVRIILSGDNAKLIINEKEVASSTITLNPDEVTSFDDSFYLSRGYKDNYFMGSMDYFNVYFKEGEVPTYNYTEKETPVINSLVGDIKKDGLVDNMDLIFLCQFLIKDIQFDELQLKASDLTGDELIDVADCAILKQHIMGDNVLEKP